MSGISLCFGSDDVIESIGQLDTDNQIDRRCLICRMELRVYSMGRISRNTLYSLKSCVVLLIYARRFISVKSDTCNTFDTRNLIRFCDIVRHFWMDL